MSLFGPPNIEKLTAKPDIAGLIKALGYEKDAGVRQAAAKALITFGASAMEDLAPALQDKNVYIRHGAAWVLGRTSDKRAVPLLLPLLKDPKPSIREVAASSLGNLGDGIAVESLIQMLQDENNGVRKAAARALGELHDSKAVDPLINMLGISMPVDPLISILGISTPDDEIRAIASWALGEIKDSRSVEPLIRAAQKDSSKLVRESAAWALGQLGDARAMDPLVSLLKDQYETVRTMAAQSLEQLGWTPGANAESAQFLVLRGEWERCIEIGAPAVEPLIEALRSNTDRDARKAAALSLGRIRDRRAIEPLIAAIDPNSYESHPVSIAAVTALGMLGDEQAVKPLIAVLHASWGIGAAAARVLIQIGSPAVEPLQVLLRSTRDPEAGQMIRLLLAQIGDARVLEMVIPMLEDRDAEIVEIAAGGLIKMGAAAVQPLLMAIRPYGKLSSTNAHATARQVLIKIGSASKEAFLDALHDQNSYVRQGAAGLLDELGWKPDDGEAGAWYWMAKLEWKKCLALRAHAAAPLLAALKDQDTKIRQDAMTAIGQLEHPESIRMLVSALVDQEIRERVGEALKILGINAVPPLIAALKEENEELRAAAALVLGQIRDEQALEPLVDLLETGKEPTSRVAAARALGALGGQNAIEPLYQAFKDEQEEVRLEAAIILGRMGDARAFGPLRVAASNGSSTASREMNALIKNLQLRNWEPDKDEQGAWYWITTGKWEECIPLGAASIDPLIAMLKSSEWKVQQSASRTLVAIHAKGSLDEKVRQKILDQRAVITQPHADSHEDSHADNYNGVCGVNDHTDYSSSNGIGVDFPL